jgi:hypothetical protein
LIQVPVPKSQDAIAAVFQIGCSNSIVRYVFRLVVLVAVKFDNEFLFEANEIRDVGADGLLPPELVHSHATIPQRDPKLSFGVCLVAAKPARKIVLHQFVIARKRANPSPASM